MSYSRDEMIGLGVFFMLLPVVFVILRVKARRIRSASLSWDDYTIIGSLAFTIGACVCVLIAAIHGELGQHQTTGPSGQPNIDDPKFLIYEKCKLGLEILATLGFGCTKISVILFYLRIFSASNARVIAQIMLGLVVVWTVIFFFGTIFQCYPVTALVEPFYGRNCFQTIHFYYAGCITDIIIDFAILVFPIPLVIGLKLGIKQKLAVLGIFLLGTLAAASSIARVVVFFQAGETLALHQDDVAYDTSGVFLWTVIELVLGIISACLPTLRPLVISWRREYTPHSYENQSRPVKRQPRYRRAIDTIDELEMPVLASSENSARVRNHIQGSEHDDNMGQPREGVILVNKSTKWTDSKVFTNPSSS